MNYNDCVKDVLEQSPLFQPSCLPNNEIIITNRSMEVDYKMLAIRHEALALLTNIKKDIISGVTELAGMKSAVVEEPDKVISKTQTLLTKKLMIASFLYDLAMNKVAFYTDKYTNIHHRKNYYLDRQDHCPVRPIFHKGNTLPHIDDDADMVIQLKREIDCNGNMTFTWVIVVCGVVVSRGSKQPILKLLTSFVKPLKWDKLYENEDVQQAFKKLKEMESVKKPYYVYYTNKNIAEHYIALCNVTKSCMAYDRGSFEELPDDMHPMDGFNDSPDWRLMLISKLSPTEIEKKVTEGVFNEQRPDGTRHHPWVARAMVLPKLKLRYGKDKVHTPWVMARMYGHDAVLKGLMAKGTDPDYIHTLNDNPLVTTVNSITGGRIKVIAIPDAENNYVLPYFDQSNKALMVDDPEGKWWISLGDNIKYYNIKKIVKPNETLMPFVAHCNYRNGIARTDKVYNPYTQKYIALDSRTHSMETIKTPLGDIHMQLIKDKCFVPVRNSGKDLWVPLAWTHKHNSKYYLETDCVTTISGFKVPLSVVQRNKQRYVELPPYGWFDLHLTADVAIYELLINQSLIQGNTNG